MTWWPRVADTPIGTPVTLTVDRDGKKMEFKVTIQDRAEVFKELPRIRRIAAAATCRRGAQARRSSI